MAEKCQKTNLDISKSSGNLSYRIQRENHGGTPNSRSIPKNIRNNKDNTEEREGWIDYEEGLIGVEGRGEGEWRDHRGVGEGAG